jgi:chromosome segregation ATPase
MNKKIILCSFLLVSTHIINAYDEQFEMMEQEANELINTIEKRYEKRIGYLSRTLKEARKKRTESEEKYSSIVSDYEKLETEHKTVLNEYEALEKRNQSLITEKENLERSSSNRKYPFHYIEDLKEKMSAAYIAYNNEKEDHKESQKILDEETEKYERALQEVTEKYKREIEAHKKSQKVLDEETEKYERAAQEATEKHKREIEDQTMLIESVSQKLESVFQQLEQSQNNNAAEKAYSLAREEELLELKEMHPETFANRDAQRRVSEAQEHADSIGAKSSIFLW